MKLAIAHPHVVTGCVALGLLVATGAGRAAEPTKPAGELAGKLAQLDGRVIVLGTVREPPLAPMLARDLRAALREANLADARAWEQVKDRADWERFRDERIKALRASLGQFPPAPKDVKVRISRSLQGDGYRVDNIVFESRPGLLVTANLYRPAKPATSMPGLVVVHSHGQPKHTGARQDMGMTWARAGCLVLVPDQLGHGERRQHPFGTAADFPKPFLLARQDYYFRYDNAMLLDLIGESLMGWMVWDLSRGVDVLLAQPGVDARRIVLVSEPAGGGDPAAVVAALDSRIAGAVVTNFGGPQPESPYPLPRDAEQTFEYAGSGSWESTRNLRLSARDGFLPWVIVAAAAPRRLVHNQEFYWDRETDPVWKRLQKVYGFYNAADSLTGAAGRGFVVGSAPENTHWIAVNREVLYPIFERWFGIPNPKKEYSNQRPIDELQCLTPEAIKEFKPEPLYRIAGRLGAERTSAARAELARLNPEARRERLCRDWARLLGDVAPKADPVVRETRRDEPLPGGAIVERLHLSTEPGIVVPVLLLLPPGTGKDRLPVVVAVAQAGKQEFLKQRAETIARLLENGVAVCLPDVRGTGETSPPGARDRTSAATALSATALMLGQPLLGARLRDLRAVLRYLRHRPEVDGKRIALWGDSFAAPNAADSDLRVPHGIDGRPRQSEPLGGLLALLGALFDPDIRAVHVQGGLSGYLSVLENPFGYLPHDAVIPGVLTIGDLSDTAAALAPRPLVLTELVDGANRLVPAESLARTFEPARTAYRTAGAEQQLHLLAKPIDSRRVADWLPMQLK
jgi:dienelactone hydrolase